MYVLHPDTVNARCVRCRVAVLSLTESAPLDILHRLLLLMLLLPLLLPLLLLLQPPLCLSSKSSVLEVSKKMADVRADAAILLNSRGHLEGIISDNDVARYAMAYARWKSRG